MSVGPIRIAFCHYTSDVFGGSDRALFDLVTHLDPTRFTPFLLLKTGDPLAEEYRARGFEVAQLPFVSPRNTREWRKHAAFFGWYGPHTVRAARQFRRWDVDLVHVNTANNLQGPVAAKLAGKPLVWHVREWLPDSRVGAAMRGLVARLATRAIAISNAVAGSLGGCGGRLQTVFDGIDLGAYLAATRAPEVRREWDIAEDAPVVACVGRLEPWKGQHVLVEAVPAMLARCPEMRVLIVGGAAANKPEYDVALKRRCGELGVAHAVHFTGIRRDIPRILAAADVLALPSVSPEPFGLTVIEAMASGCPVVATNRGGPLDSVEDGATGLLVPPDDAAALGDAICDIVRDRERAGAMGERGRARAVEKFSIDRLVAEMSRVFEAVCVGR